jgi:DNA-binding CsgD family transcriptional regulator
MKKQHSKFYLSAKKIWNTVVKIDRDSNHELKLQLELHKQLLSLFQPGSYYYYIFNIYQGEFDFVSPTVTALLGYLPEEMNVPFVMENMHPDDKPYFLKFEYHIAQFFKTLPFDQIQNYKVQYDFRIKAKNSQYVRMLHQAVQVNYDKENFYHTLGLDTDISHIKQDGLPSFSIIGLAGQPSYYNITGDYTLTQSYDIFTRREREILKLIVENKNSKEIADLLFISLHTVNSHRKNILEKAGAKTPIELVSKAISEGWI